MSFKQYLMQIMPALTEHIPVLINNQINKSTEILNPLSSLFDLNNNNTNYNNDNDISLVESTTNQPGRVLLRNKVNMPTAPLINKSLSLFEADIDSISPQVNFTYNESLITQHFNQNNVFLFL